MIKQFETFPIGARMANTCTTFPGIGKRNEQRRNERLFAIIKDAIISRKYNLYNHSTTRKFGATDTLFRASTLWEKRYFSTGIGWQIFAFSRWGDYGTFHIWHKSSDLYLSMDLNTASVRPLTEINSPDVDSYHSWSSSDDGFCSAPAVMMVRIPPVHGLF